jgi:hypothetical protein
MQGGPEDTLPDTHLPSAVPPTLSATIMAHAAALAEIATLLPRDADRMHLEELVLALATMAKQLGRHDEAARVEGGR